MTDCESENDAQIVRNAGNSFELLFRLLHEETAIVRGNLRRFGQTVRDFFQHHFTRKEVYAGHFLKLASKAAPSNMHDFEEFNETSRCFGKFYDIPPRTFIDIADVLLKDEDEGVICKIPLQNPKWDKLPDYSPLVTKDMDTCEFQLWNRPMGSPCTMPEDEDERLSLPSTRATDWGREKIDTVEAQLALLTRQMHHLLQLQQQQKIPTTRATPIRSPVQLSDSSEDEGRGASLNSVMCSPLFKKKPSKLDNIIPLVAPPPGLPPPPPPRDLLKAKEIKTIVQSKPEKIEQQRPVRPTAADLRNVQLRKVVARSPGGTPQDKQRKGSSECSQESTNVLANALLERFRAIHGSYSEQDEQDTSWADDE